MVAPNNHKVTLQDFLNGNPTLLAMIGMVKVEIFNKIARDAVMKYTPNGKTTNEPVTVTRQELDALCACTCLALDLCSLINFYD